jgi:hypothetical protein
MAIKARIVLKGCASHVCRGKRHKKDVPFYSTNAAEIAYYKNTGVFDVTIIPEEQDKPPIEEIQTINLQQDPFEDIVQNNNTTDVSEGVYTKTILSTRKKSELIAIANDEFGLNIEDDQIKKQIISSILKAQIDVFSEEETELEEIE